jgi:hypothetical protein
LSSSWVSAEYAFYMRSKVHSKYILVTEKSVQRRHNKMFIRRTVSFLLFPGHEICWVYCDHMNVINRPFIYGIALWRKNRKLFVQDQAGSRLHSTEKNQQYHCSNYEHNVCRVTFANLHALDSKELTCMFQISWFIFLRTFFSLFYISCFVECHCRISH